ncbi:MAG: hypothetical protein M3P93_16305 [Actinomycetota bacterium]|nr:hypothetical protein [Actinomycetota bacterium]
MGSGLDEPFDISIPTKAAVAAVRAVLQSTSIRAAKNGCLTDTCDCPFVRDYSAPCRSRARCRYVDLTKGDGVVRWRACAVPYARTVEISGSHIGLVFNRRAYRVLGLLLGGRAEEVRTVPAYDGPTDAELRGALAQLPHDLREVARHVLVGLLAQRLDESRGS